MFRPQSLPFYGLSLLLLVGAVGFSVGANLAYTADTAEKASLNASQWEEFRNPEFNRSSAAAPQPPLSQEWVPEPIRQDPDPSPPPAWVQTYIETILVATGHFSEAVAGFIYPNRWWFIKPLASGVMYSMLGASIATMLYPARETLFKLYKEVPL